MSERDKVSGRIASAIPPIAERLDNAMQEFIKADNEAREAPTARGIYKRLAERVKSFEASLDEGHEVGAMLASFGQAVRIHVSYIGYIQPSIIIFQGRLESGESVELVQHINQLSFLLIKVLKLEPEKPRRSIGFAKWES